VSAKVLGNYGDEVTAVLANAPGGLELLPSEKYGNGWLRVTHKGSQLDAWPKKGDPYNEIYKVRGKWYALFPQEEWINPSGLPPSQGGGTFKRICEYLDQAQSFHRRIADTFDLNSYAHYGADPNRRSFAEVVWKIDDHCVDPTGWQNWPILDDTKQGMVELVRWVPRAENKAFRYIAGVPKPIHATILPPADPGDQTVPMKSADHQLNSGIFKGVFRQVGYEHQDSYKDPRTIASTLYSIVRIAQEARYKCFI
jgi:hypothetical protein